MYHVARKLRWVLGKIYSQRGSGDEALQAIRSNDDVSQQLECLNYNVDDRDEQTKQKSTEKNMFKSENVNDENRSAIEAKRKEIKSLELALAAKEGDLFREIADHATVRIKKETEQQKLRHLGERLNIIQRSHFGEVEQLEREIREEHRLYENRVSEIAHQYALDDDVIRRTIYHVQVEKEKEDLLGVRRARRGEILHQQRAKNADIHLDGIERSREMQVFKSNDKSSLSRMYFESLIQKTFCILKIVALFIVFVLSVFSLNHITELYILYKNIGISANIFCSPVVPYHTTLGEYPFTYEAPFLMPKHLKKYTFTLFCSDRPRTRVLWFGKSKGRVIIENIDLPGGSKPLASADYIEDGAFKVHHLRVESTYSSDPLVYILPWVRY